jgi:hypothetical protein
MMSERLRGERLHEKMFAKVRDANRPW